MNNIENILEQKIDILLQWNIHEAEQRLVALLLLTRIEDPAHVLQNHPELVEFLLRLIQHNNHPQNRSRQTYIRLASQLLPACFCCLEKLSSPSPSSSCTPLKTQVHAIANVLIDSLTDFHHPNNNVNDTQSNIVSIEILISLEDSLEHVSDHDVLDEILYRIWERSRKKVTPHSASTLDCTTTNFDDESTPKQQQPKQDQKMMDETLDKLLNQTTSFSFVNDADDDNQNDIQQVDDLFDAHLVQLLEHHGVRLMKERQEKSSKMLLPKFYKSVLDDWFQSAKNQSKQSSRIRFARLLLVLLQNVGQHPMTSLVRLDENLASHLVSLVLACIISTTRSSDELRTMAWSTIASWLESDWKWLLGTNTPKTVTKTTVTMTNKTNLSLGKCQNLCTIVRLAAGEWKIQLEKELGSHDNDRLDRSANSKHVLILEYCAKVLVLTVSNIIIPLSESDAKSMMDWTGDSILHLRQSLEEALQAAVEYMGLVEQNCNVPVDGAVIRVLATLWTEFDIFEETHFVPTNVYDDYKENDKRREEKDHDDHISKLQALRMALQISVKNVELQEQLLPCLTTIFASAEEDVHQVALLRQYILCDDNVLMEFWDRYWSETTNIAIIHWACQWMELCYGMQVFMNVTRIQTALIQFVQRALSQPPSKDMVNALSDVIGCYVTLQGEKPPNDPDATILQSAMEYCTGFDGFVNVMR